MSATPRHAASRWRVAAVCAAIAASLALASCGRGPAPGAVAPGSPEVPPARGLVSADTGVATGQSAEDLEALRIATAAADSAAARDDSLDARIDTLAARHARGDTAVVITTRPAKPRKGAPPPEPPYRIEADRMSGGRGPQGDVLYLEKVNITRSGTRLQSERGRYERATGMVYVEGNVRLRDSTAKVNCDAASFSENEDRLDLRGNVVVIDRDATLKAPYGWYDRKAGIARLQGGVRGQEKNQRIAADEATYERDSMMVRARGNVVGDDDENKIRLEASSVDFDRRAKVAVATGDPLMRARDDDGKETVLRARLLRVNSLTRIAEAVDSVRVERDTLRATARYAVFDDSTGRGLLLGNPRAGDNETELSGDTLETFAVERKLQRILVKGAARIDYTGGREANRGESSRLAGQRVEMFVSGSRVDSLVATGKASNAYAAVARPGKTAEQNLAEGDTIFVYFKDRKIDRARVQGRATGEYRPPVAEGDTVAARNERITYEGQHIDFVIPRNEIVLDGDAHLNYREMELRARRVVFDSEEGTLVAEGKPTLLEKGDEVTGQLMTYDMDRRVGTIYQATTRYEQGLYHGRQIRKASENELDVLGGSYSTCDLEHPHYHFSARYMKIYMKDKLVAKPVVFYLRNVPVLALPFYVFPIKPGRHSGFLFPQFEFGFNTTTGQFIRNAGYYWAPSDYFDVMLGGDYYQAQPSWLTRAELNYKLLYAFDGHVEGQFERDDFTGSEDWRVYANHQQTVSDRTRFSLLANFVSSREYSGSALSGQSLQQRLNRFLTSSLQLSHYAEWISLNAVVDRREDLDADLELQDPDGTGSRLAPPIGTNSALPSLSMTIPSLSASLPTRALGSYASVKDTRLGKALATTYLNVNGRFLGQLTQKGFVSDRDYFLNASGLPDSVNVVSTAEERRWAGSSAFALTDSRRLFGWINFAPSFAGNAVLWDHDEQGNKVVPAAVWTANLGTSSTFYRVYRTPMRSLSLRHVFSPAFSVNYAPDFPGLSYTDSNGVRQPKFDGFGDIGLFSGRKTTRAQFAMDHRIQAKHTRGEKVTRLDNLLSWTTSSSYDFLYKQNGALHPLGLVSTAIRLQPPGYVSGDASSSIDVYSQRPLRAFNYNIGASLNSRGAGKPQATRVGTETPELLTVGEEASDFRETWSLALAYSYAGGYQGPKWSSRESVNGVLNYQLTENWSFDYQAGLDLTARSVILQRFSLTRRIHCWNAQFSRTFLIGGETEYYFRLGIRDQREVYYERGTRAQSFGGIQ